MEKQLGKFAASDAEQNEFAYAHHGEVIVGAGRLERVEATFSNRATVLRAVIVAAEQASRRSGTTRDPPSAIEKSTQAANVRDIGRFPLRTF